MNRKDKRAIVNQPLDPELIKKFKSISLGTQYARIKDIRPDEELPSPPTHVGKEIHIFSRKRGFLISFDIPNFGLQEANDGLGTKLGPQNTRQRTNLAVPYPHVTFTVTLGKVCLN